jgi:hypothetical protein
MARHGMKGGRTVTPLAITATVMVGLFLVCMGGIWITAGIVGRGRR